MIAVGVTVGVTAAGARATTGASTQTAVLEAIARGVIVGIPLAVGLYAWRHPAHERFGRLLLAFGGLWFLAALSTSSSPLLFSIGRVAGWVAQLGLVYTVLAFPKGRLTGRFDRRWSLHRLGGRRAVRGERPTGGRYPAPSPWANCYRGCPDNAFMALDHQPGFVDSVLAPARELLTAIHVPAGRRPTWRCGSANASLLMRRTLTPCSRR